MSSRLAAEPILGMRPPGGPVYRTIVAVDIEGSTARPNPAKGELRHALYDLLDRALASAGITPMHREPHTDRGDGILTLIRPHDDVPKTLVPELLVPILGALVTEHNASVLRSELQMRLRVAVHVGEVHEDNWGFYGDNLDVAFRLLDAPVLKKALREAPGAPLVLVFSEAFFGGIAEQDCYPEADAYRPLVRVRIGQRQHRGRVHIPQVPKSGTFSPGRRPAGKSSPPSPVLASAPGRSPSQPEDQQALAATPSVIVLTSAPAVPDVACPAVPDSARPAQSVSFASVYEALKQRMAETHEPFDTEDGLARLKEWMVTRAASPFSDPDDFGQPYLKREA